MQRAAYAQDGLSPPPEYTADCRRLQRACRLPAWSKATNQEHRHVAVDGDTVVDQDTRLAGTQGADQRAEECIPDVPDMFQPVLCGLPHIPGIQLGCARESSDTLQPIDTLQDSTNFQVGIP